MIWIVGNDVYPEPGFIIDNALIAKKFALLNESEEAKVEVTLAAASFE